MVLGTVELVKMQQKKGHIAFNCGNLLGFYSVFAVKRRGRERIRKSFYKILSLSSQMIAFDNGRKGKDPN